MSERDQRRAVVVTAAYAVMVACWLVVALAVLPPAVVAANRLEGTTSPLRWLIHRGPAPIPEELALERWREFAAAVAMATGLHLGLTLAALRWRRIPAAAAFVVLGAAFLAATVVFSVIQDYYLHLQIWREVRLGNDPWFLVHGVFGTYPLNAYGPLFCAIAPLAWVNPLLPKLLFAAAYLGFALWLVRKLDAQGVSAGWIVAGMVWLFNPYVWVEIAYYGHFDIVVGLCAVAAVEARVRRRDATCATALAAGVLLKYLPMVLLPFLALDRGRIRWRLVGWTLGLTTLGLGLGVLIWGPSALRPIGFAASRYSTYLSVYRYLKGPYSPLRPPGIIGNPDDLANVILLLAGLRAWSWGRLRQIDARSLSALAVLTTLLLYKVGFPQYQIVWFVVATSWVVHDFRAIPHLRTLIAAMLLYFGWIAAFNLIESSRGIGFLRMEDWVGLPTFLLGVALVVCTVRSSRSEDRAGEGGIGLAERPTTATAGSTAQEVRSGRGLVEEAAQPEAQTEASRQSGGGCRHQD